MGHGTSHSIESKKAVPTTTVIRLTLHIPALNPGGQRIYFTCDGMAAQFGYRDENTGFLYLLGHRFYDMQFGQFMTRDPMGYEGGVNLYGYTGNNPVNESDPDGTQIAAPVVVGGAAAEGREWDVQTGGGHINVGGDTGTAKYPVKRGRR